MSNDQMKIFRVWSISVYEGWLFCQKTDRTIKAKSEGYANDKLKKSASVRVRNTYIAIPEGEVIKDQYLKPLTQLKGAHP